MEQLNYIIEQYPKSGVSCSEEGGACGVVACWSSTELLVTAQCSLSL